MKLDVKLPLGLIFSLIGLLLVLSGIFLRAGVLEKIGFNLNLIWGFCVLAFGLLMLLLHRYQR